MAGAAEEPAGGGPGGRTLGPGPREPGRGPGSLDGSLTPGACEASAASEGVSPAQRPGSERGRVSAVVRTGTSHDLGIPGAAAPALLRWLSGPAGCCPREPQPGKWVSRHPRARWVPPHARGPGLPHRRSERLPEALPEGPVVAKWPAQPRAGAFKGLAHAVCLCVAHDATSS